jgi:hypothetical protein
MPNTTPAYVAGGTIRPCRFIKADSSASHTVLEADANERTVGIAGSETNQPPLSDLVSSSNHATTGQSVHAYGPGEECYLELGDTVVNGGLLKSDADGKGVPIASTGTTIQQVGARALEDGVSGNKIRVEVIEYSERPALV